MSATIKQLRELGIHTCAVPDCTKRAVDVVPISINNAPRKPLPVCQQHKDAAAEDWMPVQTKTGQVSIDKRKAIDDLKKLNSLPPYDGFNPCGGDGYFALAMTKEYGMSIEDLEKAVGFKELVDQWRAMRTTFLSSSQ